MTGGNVVATVARSRQDEPGTATLILDAAEALVQVRGFNGFSYADIAADLRITKAALHYHFTTKADLGEALITRYASRFAAALSGIDAAQVLSDNRMCLCGMLAAEYQTLPPLMRAAVIAFFDDNESWLAGLLEQGRREGTLRLETDPRDAARMIVSGLEGAMLLARSYGDFSRFQTAADSLIASVTPSGAAAAAIAH
jgi:TetR/AcrR family transcriptional regulator, transcriptional repressor for nem operon